MLNVKSAFQFQPRDDKNAYRSLGIIHMPAQKVTDSARGIAYDRPGGFFARTWLGNIQMTPGDWLVTCGSGNRYVVKEADYCTVSSARCSFWRGMLEKLLNPLMRVP